MSRLAFKVNITHALSNFIGLKDVFDTSVDQGLRDTAAHVKDLMIRNYELSSVAPQHPLTLARKTLEGYQKVDIPNRITEEFDEKGDLRVGFFDQPREEMRLIYRQEFGGNIPITEKMRTWYNTMAYISMGWEPDSGTTSPSSFSHPFKPLRDSTQVMRIPAKQFIRDTFDVVGNSNVLANRLLRALDSFTTGRFVGGNNIVRDFL